MAACLSFLSLAGHARKLLPLAKMAPAGASLPCVRALLFGFTARASTTPPRFRRKKRRERWRRLRFEFQRRRQSPNESRSGGGGDPGSLRVAVAGEASRRSRCGHRRRHLLRVHDGLGVGRRRHPPRDAQRLQVRPGLCRGAVTRPGFPLMGVQPDGDSGLALEDV